MKSHTLLVFLVALVLVALFSVNVSAVTFASIDKVTVNGIEGFEKPNSGQRASVFAGETIPVRVVILARGEESDVRIVARITGAGSFSEVSKRFAVLDTNGSNLYSALLNVKVPFDIDPSENLFLEITVESANGGVSDRITIPLTAQRDSYLVEIQDILPVMSNDQAEAGKVYAFDVVLVNRGFEEARNIYLRATIPELGVSNTVFFGDLSPEDQSRPRKADTEQRRVYLNLPKNAAPGIYTIELEAYNTDSSTVRTKRIVLVGSGAESRVLSPVTSKTFAVGQEMTYSLTIVNSGNEIKVYEVLVEAPAGLTVDADAALVAVPAGTSKNVILTAKASKEGSYTFAVNVHSDGALVATETLTATVEGSSAKVNPSVVLTVILAVIFIVLVIVLIVLLTRKPQKTEEFGESYY